MDIQQLCKTTLKASMEILDSYDPNASKADRFTKIAMILQASHKFSEETAKRLAYKLDGKLYEPVAFGSPENCQLEQQSKNLAALQVQIQEVALGIAETAHELACIELDECLAECEE